MCEHECVCVKVCVCMCVYIYIYIDTHSGWPVSLHVRQLQQNVVTSKSMWPKNSSSASSPHPINLKENSMLDHSIMLGYVWAYYWYSHCSILYLLFHAFSVS